MMFQSAKPVWPEGRATEQNLFVGFRAAIPAARDDRPVLRVTAASLYRAFVNGRFLGHGPARGRHGYARVDEWPLAEHLVAGVNWVALEVAGYNVPSFYLPNQPAFLQAEIVAGGKVLAATAGSGPKFQSTVLQERLQKVAPCSVQRKLSEVYRLPPGYERWRIGHGSRRTAPAFPLPRDHSQRRGL